MADDDTQKAAQEQTSDPVPSDLQAGETGAESEEEEEEVVADSVVEVQPMTEAPKPAATLRKDRTLPPPPPSTRVKGVNRLELVSTPKVARDLMTKKILTIRSTDSLEHLEEQMRTFHVRHLPVVDGHKLVGLITLGDLRHASSSYLSDKAKERDAIIHKLPAVRIMQKELITVKPTDPLLEVSYLMWEARVSCVLVTEEDGTLVGIITEGDFLRLAHHYLTQQHPIAQSKPKEPAPGAPTPAPSE